MRVPILLIFISYSSLLFGVGVHVFQEENEVTQRASIEVNECCGNDPATFSIGIPFICKNERYGLTSSQNCIKQKFKRSNTHFTILYQDFFNSLPPEVNTIMQENCFKTGESDLNKMIPKQISCMGNFLQGKFPNNSKQSHFNSKAQELGMDKDEIYRKLLAANSEFVFGGMMELACQRQGGHLIVKENSIGLKSLEENEMRRFSDDFILDPECSMRPLILNLGKVEDSDAPKDMQTCLHAYYADTTSEERYFTSERICNELQGTHLDPFFTELTGYLTYSSLNDYIEVLRIEAVSRFMNAHHLLVGIPIPNIPSKCSSIKIGMEKAVKQDLPKGIDFEYGVLNDPNYHQIIKSQASRVLELTGEIRKAIASGKNENDLVVQVQEVTSILSQHPYLAVGSDHLKSIYVEGNLPAAQDFSGANGKKSINDVLEDKKQSLSKDLMSNIEDMCTADHWSLMALPKVTESILGLKDEDGNPSFEHFRPIQYCADYLVKRGEATYNSVKGVGTFGCLVGSLAAPPVGVVCTAAMIGVSAYEYQHAKNEAYSLAKLTSAGDVVEDFAKRDELLKRVEDAYSDLKWNILLSPLELIGLNSAVRSAKYLKVANLEELAQALEQIKYIGTKEEALELYSKIQILSKEAKKVGVRSADIAEIYTKSPSGKVFQEGMQQLHLLREGSKKSGQRFLLSREVAESHQAKSLSYLTEELGLEVAELSARQFPPELYKQGANAPAAVTRVRQGREVVDRRRDIFRLIEITKPASKVGSMSPMEMAVKHPLFGNYLRKLQEQGYKVAIDPSLELMGRATAGYDEAIKTIKLSPESTFADFMHEFQHILTRKFIAEIPIDQFNQSVKSGTVDEIVAANPKLKKLIKDGFDLDTFKELAGKTNFQGIDETAATRRQLELYAESGYKVFDQNVVDAIQYGFYHQAMGAKEMIRQYKRAKLPVPPEITEQLRKSQLGIQLADPKNWDEFLRKAGKVAELDKKISRSMLPDEVNEVISRSTFGTQLVANAILDEETGDYLFELIDGTYVSIDLALMSKDLPVVED